MSGRQADMSGSCPILDKALPLFTHPLVTSWQNIPKALPVYSLVSCLIRAKQDVESPTWLASGTLKTQQVTWSYLGAHYTIIIIHLHCGCPRSSPNSLTDFTWVLTVKRLCTRKKVITTETVNQHVS